MLKVAITGERRAELVEAPDPQPVGDWVLVEVQAAPMCTEYKGWLAGDRSEHLGHEAAGRVAAVAEPGPVEVGDRVVVMPQYPCGVCSLCKAGDYIYCQHTIDFAKHTGSPEGRATMAQYLLKPAWLLPKIPDGVSYEHASLACCGLGPSYGAFRALGLAARESVLITGLGPVGLGAVVNAKHAGARVIAVDGVAARRERAEGFGAWPVLDPADPDLAPTIRALTSGGVDCALDCSGTVAAQRLCLEATRRRGRVAFVGECSEPLPVRVSPDLIRNGLTVIGSWHYNLADFPAIMRTIQENPLVPRLISHLFPMSKVQQAFELSASQQAAKIILQPWR